MILGRSSERALMNRLRLFSAESIRCPITSFLLHLSWRGFAENSTSLIALIDGSIVSSTLLMSSMVRFITTLHADLCGIPHSFRQATAEGTRYAFLRVRLRPP